MKTDTSAEAQCLDERETSDGVLLDRIARGDEEALGVVSRRYSITLYTLAYGILVDSREADRVVARVLAALRRDAARGLSGPFPVRWLLTELTRAHALNLLRLRGVHHSSATPPPSVGAIPESPAEYR